MRNLIRIMLLILLTGTAPASLYAQQKPNVLMISVDDLNDYIHGMGHPDAITPNIDRLMKRGVSFVNAQTPSPLCGPSRAALMTGLRPSTTGIYGLLPDDSVKTANSASRDNIFLHQYFKDRGYYAMGVGKIFHINFPSGLMDEQAPREKQITGPKPAQRINYNIKGTDTDWGAYPEKDEDMPDFRTAAWAVERLSRSYKQPFFLSVGFFRPHVPWHVPKKWFDLYDPKKLTLPAYLPTDLDDLPKMAYSIESLFMPTTQWAKENNQWRNMLQGYLASISFADHQIGRVLDALDASPYADNTVIVLWSDHGYRMGEKNRFAKMALWDRATKTPYIFAGPGIAKDKIVAAPVELFSLYPTLLDLCKLPPNKDLEAKSIYPLLKATRTRWNYPTLTTWGRDNHGVRLGNYHYIRYADGSEEFYDLKSDPNEWYNKASDPRYSGIKTKLMKALPKTNAKWAAASNYDNVEYFKKQRLEDLSP